MVAVVAVLTVPRALSSDDPERAVAPLPGPAASAPVSAPDRFNPLAGHLLYLTVSSRGTCPVTASEIRRKLRAGQTVQVSCADDGFAPTGVAPDVNGRPASWLNYGEGIAWEYAPGAWASLQASGYTACSTSRTSSGSDCARLFPSTG